MEFGGFGVRPTGLFGGFEDKLIGAVHLDESGLDLPESAAFLARGAVIVTGRGRKHPEQALAVKAVELGRYYLHSLSPTPLAHHKAIVLRGPLHEVSVF